MSLKPSASGAEWVVQQAAAASRRESERPERSSSSGPVPLDRLCDAVLQIFVSRRAGAVQTCFRFNLDEPWGLVRQRERAGACWRREKHRERWLRRFEEVLEEQEYAGAAISNATWRGRGRAGGPLCPRGKGESFL